MKLYELYPEHDIDEGIKTRLAAMGLAGAAAMSGGQKIADHPIPPSAAISTPVAAKVTPVAAPIVKTKASASSEQIKHATDLMKTPKAAPLIKAARAVGITGTELAQFIAQCAHETLNFTRMGERGGNDYFMKKYDKKYNPVNANLLGNTKIGDGARYHGRGYIQLTGRWNYRTVGRVLGLDLEGHPELADHTDVAAKIAVWYWLNRVTNKVDDFTNTRDVTKTINSKLAGLDDRHTKFQGLNHILGK